jgi:hypothetical protein
VGPSAKALLQWIARYGLVSTIVIDNPSHFKNSLIETLIKTLRIEHHIVMSYSPWANGGIERHNRDCFKFFCTVLGESGPDWSLNRWPDIVPLVQYSLNTTECSTLGNMSPFEVFTGRKSKSTTDLLAFSGHSFSSTKAITVSPISILKHISDLRITLAKIGTQVKQEKKSLRIKNNKGRKPIDQPHIHIGDYLLLVRKREKHSKLQCNWTGPYVALAPLTPFIWKIQAIDQSPPIEAHIQRLKRYADSSLMKPLRLIEEVRGEQEQCELDKFIDWRIDQDTLMLELKCRWRGFTEA